VPLATVAVNIAVPVPNELARVNPADVTISSLVICAEDAEFTVLTLRCLSAAPALLPLVLQHTAVTLIE
jgi:hypothetical protein